MTKISKMLLTMMLGSLVSVSALAQSATVDKAESLGESAGKALDNSLNHVGNFMDDSAITATVKSALISNKKINNADISISTEKKVVTLSGFIDSQHEKNMAVASTKKIEGVAHVIDKLHVREAQPASVSRYAGDAVITSQIKARLLAKSDIHSRHISVKTSGGMVLLSGDVESKDQARQVVALVKDVTGVQGVKSDLKVKGLASHK